MGEEKKERQQLRIRKRKEIEIVGDICRCEQMYSGIIYCRNEKTFT